MSTPIWLIHLFITLVIVLLSASVHSQLQVGFYRNSCSLAEHMVKSEVRKWFIKDRGIAPGLIRLHFHDCFVRGCVASVLIDSTPSNTAEKASPVNNPSLRGFEVIDDAKSSLESVCKGVVSCADILAFAARDSVEMSGGMAYDVPAGRRDGRISKASEASANLPTPTFNVSQLTQSFASKGLTQKEMVILSGAHTVGRSHCTSFTHRLYNFSGTMHRDSSLDPVYATQLKQQCPKGSMNAKSVVPMNPESPSILDVSYYADILMNRGLFTSDQTLMTDRATAYELKQCASCPPLWNTKFAAAMVKMGRIHVLTGKAGEIRANCRFVNSKKASAVA